jgi:RNA polymerase sigma-70 factor (ECF subfamily)
MLFGSEHMARADTRGGMEPRFMQGVLPSRPRSQVVAYRDEWLILHWYAHQDVEAVRAITRLELDGDRVARLRNYFFNPEFVSEVCAELGLPVRVNGYRYCAPTALGEAAPG